MPRDARDAACRVLSEHAERFPDLLPTDPQVAHLEPRDRALAHAIVRESVTRWITLRHIVSELAGRGFETIEPRMQAVLIGGTAQLLLLDRLPPHAVINESVEWAKHYIRPKAGGMTNAILRKVSRCRGEVIENQQPGAIPLTNGSWLQLHGIQFPEDQISRLSILYSLPKATIKRWQHLHPEQAIDLIEHTITSPPTLIYTTDWAQIPEQDDLAPHESTTHRIYTGSRVHLTKFLTNYPELRVQDSASTSVVQQIPEGSYNTIIDYCAGQGTKTRQLLERFPDATIIATEVDSRRLDTLMDVFDGCPNVLIRHIEELPSTLSKGADLILTDVPCSNSGVLARRMEARYRPMRAQVDRIQNLQREILDAVIPYLNPQGTLVYSTCSIEQEENQDQRDWIMQTQDLEHIHEHQVIPHGTPGDDPEIYSDGSYAAVFKRK